jgi:hypothetical protein
VLTSAAWRGGDAIVPEVMRPALVEALRAYQVEFTAYVLPFAYPLFSSTRKGAGRGRQHAGNVKQRSTSA